MERRSDKEKQVQVRTASKAGAELPSLWAQAFPVHASSDGRIPNASLIYGIAAAALFAIALYFLFTGMWLTGLLLLLPCGAFLGYALHFLRYPT